MKSKAFQQQPYTYRAPSISEGQAHEPAGLSMEELLQENLQLKKELAQLSKSHQETETLFGKIEEMVFSIDLVQGQQIQMSAACEKIYGLPPADFYSNMNLWFEMILPEDRPIIEANYALMHQGKPFVNTYRIMDAQGNIKWLESKLTPTVDDNGRPIRLDGITTDITQRKEAEAMLAASESHYKQLFEVNPTPMWIRENGSLRFLNVNEATIKHYGYSREEFLDMTLLDIRSKSEQERLLSLEKGSQGIGTNAGIWKHIKKNGEEILVEVTHSDIVYEGKQARLVLAKDVTARVRAEQALKKTEMNFRTILENTDTGYFLLDAHFIVISFNEVVRRLSPMILGREIELGEAYWDLLPEHRREQAKTIVLGVYKSGQPFRYQTEYPPMDNKPTWLDITMTPIFDHDGKVVGLTVAVNNISDHKLAEQQLQESNDRFRYASKASNDAIWEWNLENDGLLWAEGYEKLFGYGKKDNQGHIKDWSKRIHSEDFERILNSVKEHVASGNKEPWHDEYRYYRADGSIAYVYDRGYVIYDSQQRPIKMVGAMQDITERKQAEMERDRITADLLQRNKDLEQFTYIVSHNLRAPLANIKGLMTLLKEEMPVTPVLDMLHTSAESLDEVVMDLNEILKVRNDISEKKEPVEFAALVNDISSSLNHIITTEKVNISTDFSKMDFLFTLKSYLYSIFYNLICNSIKYRQPNAAPKISIRSSVEGNQVLLVFNDNGLGIDLSRNQQKVFGLYKRFHQHKDGRGLGLFMVKTQVEALQGSVTIESEVNKGTTFTIALPLQL
jgi:PAS domain S-box-containing protein